MKTITRLLLALTLALAGAPPLQAQGTPPPFVDYQGLVLDAAGLPLAPDVAGAPAPVNFTMEFRLWSAASGGTTPIWGEKQNVTVSAGRFSVQLGRGQAITNAPIPPAGAIQNAFGATDRFLGVTVIIAPPAPGSEITPRLQFLTTPFAFAAGNALSASAVAQTTGSSTLTNTTLSGTTALNGTTTISSATISGGSFTGNGSGLTSLNASNIATGTVPLAQIPALPASQTTSGTFAVARIPSGLDASLIGSGTLSDSRLSANVLFGTSGLNASNLTSGTVSDARLAANIVRTNTSITLGEVTSGAFEGRSNGGTPYFDFSRSSTAVDYDVRLILQSNRLEFAQNGNYVTFDGRVGIGTTSPSAPLHVNGSASLSYTLEAAGTTGGWVDVAAQPHTGNVSIIASNIIRTAVAFHVESDARLKNRQQRSDSISDLSTLLGIEITDYTMKDTVAFGKASHKKVIAQQVEQVYPQAVSVGGGVVPDIYQKAPIKLGWIELATDLKVGERVRLLMDTNDGIHEVLEVREGAFRTDLKLTDGKVFVFGREVKDLRTVDYEAIAMLNVSATQQLKKEKDAEIRMRDEKIAALQKEVDALKRWATGQDTRLTTLEAKDQDRDRKLAALEKLLLDSSKNATPRTAALRQDGRAE